MHEQEPRLFKAMGVAIMIEAFAVVVMIGWIKIIFAILFMIF